jgi:hypothetical protein
MTQEQLHDLLQKLENARSQIDPVDREGHQRLDDLVESLEQQKLYPDDFDRYSVLADQAREIVLEIEADHPALARILEGISGVLRSFSA